MDANNNQHQQQQQPGPGTFINVTSLADINGNELVVLPVGVQAVDNGHDAMIAVIRQVHPQRVIIADAIAEAYNVDSDDVC